MSNEVQTVKSNKVADLTLTEAAQIHLKKQLV